MLQRLSGMNCKSLRKNAVDEMLENVGLFDVRDRYANKLSGGMKRRLGIAAGIDSSSESDYCRRTHDGARS